MAIQAGATIKALQNMLGHESAGLTLGRYGHLYGTDVKAVGVAINAISTRDCGQDVVTEPIPAELFDDPKAVDLHTFLWSLGDSNS